MRRSQAEARVLSEASKPAAANEFGEDEVKKVEMGDIT
jgi:hypothetical protein